jgi:hypothetical protein
MTVFLALIRRGGGVRRIDFRNYNLDISGIDQVGDARQEPAARF